jgi:hypothetical protein
MEATPHGLGPWAAGANPMTVYLLHMRKHDEREEA